MYFTGNDGLQNIFVCQPTFRTFQSQKDKGTDYILSLKSRGLYSFTLFPQCTHFLHGIKFFGDKIGIKVDKNHLVVEQNNYTTKNVNAYIVHE